MQEKVKTRWVWNEKLQEHQLVEYGTCKYSFTEEEKISIVSEYVCGHDEKYLLINQGFAGKQRLMPFFNRQNNDDLILAIQTAAVVRGRNGFRKDKGGEKLDETEENLLEHRTDSTDAFDTLYIGAEKFPHRELYPVTSSGIL